MKKPYIGVIPLNPYGSSLFVYTDQEAFIKARGLDEECVRSAGGVTTHTDDCNEFHVLFTEFTINVLTHECFHVVANLMRHRGVILCSKSEESFCYILGWIADEVYNVICSHQDKQRKKAAKATPEESSIVAPESTDEGKRKPARADAPEAEGAGVKQGAQP